MNTQENPFNAQTEPAPPGDSPPHSAAQTEEDQTANSARSVMHPEAHDTDWRYYFGAWGG